MENNKLKKIVIVLLVVAIFIMSSAYAILYRNLYIQGNASVVASWKLGITGIKEGTKVGNAVSTSTPRYTVSTASFSALLQDVNDSIEYIVTIENSGKIDAKLNDITLTKTGDSAILYEVTGVNNGDVLKSGESTTVIVKVSVDKSVTSIDKKLESNITVIFNYVQNI